MSLNNPGLVEICPHNCKISLYYFRNRQIEHNGILSVTDSRSCFYGWILEVICLEEIKDLSEFGSTTQYNRFTSKLCKLLAVIGDNSDNSKKVGIEGYSLNSRMGNASTTLMELGGCLRLALSMGKHEWIEIPPRSVKKQFTGNGKSDKIDMYRNYKEKFFLPDLCSLIGLTKEYKQTPHPVEDLVDALAVGLATIFAVSSGVVSV